MASIKKRNPISVLVLTVITLGIYGVYWFVKTKGEINSLGARIPTAWLFVIPIVNVYFVYKYAEGFSRYVRKDNHPIVWFLLYMLFLPVAIVLFQMGLNKTSTDKQQPRSLQYATDTARRMMTMLILISLTLHPLVASANVLDFWRDDEASYEYCSNFIPIAGGLVGGLIFPPLSVLGVELGVIGCDIFHKKFDWVGTAERATGTVFANPTSLASVVTPAVPLGYSGYKLVTGGIKLMQGRGVDPAALPQEKNQSQSQPPPGETTGQKGDGSVTKPSEQNSVIPQNQPQKTSSPTLTTQGKVIALVASPDGQPVYQAIFSLIDEKGNYAGEYVAGIAADVTRYTKKNGELETPPVPIGRYTLNITCNIHCMFGDKFAVDVAGDLYARWSKKIDVDVKQPQVDLGKVELKKWTKVIFAPVDKNSPESVLYPFSIKIMDDKGLAVDTDTMVYSSGKYSVSLPDGSYILLLDESYYKVVEKPFSVSGGSLDLGTFIMEKR